MKKRVILTGNSCFKIANFREGLVKRLIKTGSDVIVMAPFDDYTAMLQSWGTTVYDIKMQRNGTSLFHEFILILRMSYLILLIKPHIILSYTIKNNIYAGLISRALRIPFIPNVTGLGPAFNDGFRLKKLITLLFRLAFEKARVVFFQNSSDKETFEKKKIIDENKGKLLFGSGVNIEKFAFKPLPDRTNKTIFLLVSRLITEKGVLLYAEAAEKVRAAHQNSEFWLLGPFDKESKSAISEAEIHNWVKRKAIRYLGESKDVSSVMEKAHCIVLPTWYNEGVPRVLLEAASIGRPVITTNIPGCKDAIQHEKTGIMCEPNNLQSLIDALSYITCADVAELQGMGTDGRLMAVNKFDENFIIESYYNHL